MDSLTRLRSVLAFAVLLAFAATRAVALDAPASPNAQPGVGSMMQFFANISGRYIVAGQQEIAWSQARKDEDFNYVIQTTGKTPALRGFDFLQYTYSPSLRATQDATERAIAWSRQGGLVAFCCHMFTTTGSVDGNPHFYVPGANANDAGTRFDIRQAVISGTPENTEFLEKLDIIAAELTKLRDANVTVLWRPFHECSGGWFWWGAHGPEPLKQAWHIMFDRFTRVHKLTNLVWCFNPTDTIATNLPLWYPGDNEVDMLSIDIYPPAGTHPTRGADFRAMRDFIGGRKPVVMSENGAIPDPDVLFGSTADAAGWGYFCTWNGFENDTAQNSAAFLRTVYNHPRVITLDELAPIYAANSLSITQSPGSLRVNAGDPLTLFVSTSGGDTLTYQWSKDGVVIPGATASIYEVPQAAATDAGRYTVAVSSSASTVTSDAAEVVIAPAGAPAPIMVNIATRAYAGAGNAVAIGGFVVTGSATKRFLIRAVGPSLTAQGIPQNEVLADPLVEVHHGGSIVGQNDNWGDNTNAAEIRSVAATIGANPLADGDTTSSAMLVSLAPGVYTFIAKGRNDTSGIVLLEVYDADTADTRATFVDIATRAQSTGGNGVTIGGFVVTGNAPKRVLVRAVGPTLTTQGLAASEILADPTIEVYRRGVVIAQNDDWGSNANANEIRTTGSRIGATPFAGFDTQSSALLMFLNPGAYTFIAKGKNGASGIVLVEVYDADL